MFFADHPPPHFMRNIKAKKQRLLSMVNYWLGTSLQSEREG
jgi:hypothetical protein